MLIQFISKTFIHRSTIYKKLIEDDPYIRIQVTSPKRNRIIPFYEKLTCHRYWKCGFYYWETNHSSYTNDKCINYGNFSFNEEFFKAMYINDDIDICDYFKNLSCYHDYTECQYL